MRIRSDTAGMAISAACSALFVLAGLATSAGLSVAQEAPEGGRPWSESSEYQVEINGKASLEARLFSATGRPGILVIAPEFKQPLVIDTGERQIMMVDLDSVLPGAALDEVKLRDDEIHGPALPYTTDPEGIIFYLDGKRIKVGHRPALVGPTTVDVILSQLPAYRKGMDEYVPGEADLADLRAWAIPVKVEVWFGSWCPHCRETVPKMMKSIAAASNTNIQLVFTGVPRPPFKDYVPAKEKNITGVPTFIVYDGGREIGRISTIPAGSSLEHELAKVLDADPQRKSR